jgi:starvation-inducible DNA-binding protein
MAQSDTRSLDAPTSQKVCAILGDRLTALLDMHLTLKHVHWNVVGPNFIAVHQMLDPQVDEVRAMSDALAERIAALGGEPLGTPGAIVGRRRWDDYKINRATTQTHLAELDRVYAGIVEDNRRAIDDLEELDLVSQDIVVTQTERLELFHWFVRAHLEDADGNITH